MSDIERLAECPASLLVKRRLEALEEVQRFTDWADKLKRALEQRTGHGYVANGLKCLCGWRTQGGYPSDKQRAVLVHVKREWENYE